MRALKIKINIILYVFFTAFCGISYLCFSENFGSSIVGFWGGASLLVAGVIFFKCCFNPGENLLGDDFLKLCFTVNCAMQIPPIMCWLSYGENGFELYGVIFPSFVIILVHLFVIAWSLWNIQLLKNSTAKVAIGNTK